MASRTPRCLAAFCRDILPRLLRHTDGRRVLSSVAAIVETDRWNSFDRFQETTETLVREYESAGAVADVHRIQTGGRVGSGRWIIQEAEDIRSAIVHIVRPVRRKLLDYRDNPWHVIQWTASTPPGGMTSDLAVIDSPEQLSRLSSRALAGKMVLTRLDPRRTLKFHELARKGAAGVLSDFPVPGLPNAVKWMKFGFGGVDINHAACRIVGLMISASQGRRLRKLLREHGRVMLKIQVDVRRYVGSHDVTSGIILGRDDPQDEVWAIAHSSEPGAIDNASGVAVCVEIARAIEGAIAAGALPRPRRSIRLVSGYECHSFFNYLENVWRLQTPLAGVCIDSVGARPGVCGGRMGWHATTAMTAGFVHRVGTPILRAALRRTKPGYRLALGSFVSTPDTLIADPKYGFPCTYLETDQTGRGAFRAYHSSADVPRLLSGRGLAAGAGAMAGYLYFLADAASPELLQLAAAETAHALRRLPAGRRKIPRAQANYIREQHHVTIGRLKRWMWGGDRSEILGRLADYEHQVRDAADRASRAPKKGKGRRPTGAGRVPRRTAPLTPHAENTPVPIAARIAATGLPRWVLYWADGVRSLAEIAERISCERKKQVTVDEVSAFFEAHAELGYVELIERGDLITRARLVADLRAFGVRRGMMLMVHSSLSQIGHVAGGPDTVVDALLEVLGKTGTLVMPSFNHCEALVFNPMTTPTKNGAIPDAMWRRPDAARSLHPSHPVTAIGPEAEALCRGHLEAGIWGADSPIGRLVRSGGHILCLGVGQTSSSAYHVAELSMGGGCLDQFARVERVVRPDGTVREARGVAWRDGSCPAPVAKLGEALDRRGLRRHGTVGRADATLVKAFDLWAMRREHLKKHCPSCTIRPQTTFGTRYPGYLRRTR